MHLAALLGFVAVGLALGLLGGGGSILAVPVLVHLLGIAPGVAVPMSLPVVGITAAVGAYARWRQGHLRLGTVIGFAAIAMVTSFAAARLGAGLADTPRMILFATTMLIAATAMWRRANRMGSEPPSTLTTPAAGNLQIVAAAAAVGVLTGLVGVGGGFLIVPALVMIASLPMRRAVATSLWVIAMISAIGFVSHLLAGQRLNLAITLGFVLGGLAGMALGIAVGRRIAGPTLQKLFSVMIAAVAAFTLVRLIAP